MSPSGEPPASPLGRRGGVPLGHRQDSVGEAVEEVLGLTRPLDRAPTLHGVPVLVADAVGAVERARSEAREEAVDGFTLPELSYLSRYGDALGERGAPLRAALHALLERHAPAAAGLAVEAGCAVGAHLRVLRAYARKVIGFDMSTAALRLAASHLSSAGAPAIRRLEGRSFSEATQWALPPLQGVSVFVADALDPPVADGAADIAVALNLLDNVADPPRLLWHLARMTRPGGLVVVASPFSWRDDITPPHLQLGGGTVPELVEMGSAEALAGLMSGALPMPPPLPRLSLDVVETREVDWQIRDHARCTVHYRVHVVAARRRADR
jgi:SAM-dependent methyltransferase